MAKNITIYTTNTCASCGMVKKWLKAKGYVYDEVNIDAEPHRQAEALAASGALTVPVTVVTKDDDTKEVVIGLNLSRLAPALV